MSYDLRIENVICGFKNFGYEVNSQPVVGMEREYYEELRDGLNRIEKHADYIRKQYKLRGKSKRLISFLQSDISEPCWGVTIK